MENGCSDSLVSDRDWGLVHKWRGSGSWCEKRACDTEINVYLVFIQVPETKLLKPCHFLSDEGERAPLWFLIRLPTTLEHMLMNTGQR